MGRAGSPEPGPRPSPLGGRPLEHLAQHPAQGGDVVVWFGAAGVREPAQPGPAVVADEDVRGVEAPVHHTDVVEVGQRGGDGGTEAGDAGDGTGPVRDGVTGEPGA